MGYVLMNSPESNANEKTSIITHKLIELIERDLRKPRLVSVEYSEKRNELIIFTNKKNKRDGVVSISHTMNEFKITTNKKTVSYSIFSNIGRMDYTNKEFDINALITEILNIIFDSYIIYGRSKLTGIDDVQNIFYREQ